MRKVLIIIDILLITLLLLSIQGVVIIEGEPVFIIWFPLRESLDLYNGYPTTADGMYLHPYIIFINYQLYPDVNHGNILVHELQHAYDYRHGIYGMDSEFRALARQLYGDPNHILSEEERQYVINGHPQLNR